MGRHPGVETRAGTLGVLVVDDHLVACQLMQAMLEALSAEVEFAHSGAEAMEKAKTRRYDLVLVDFILPDTDGETLAAELRLQSGTKDAPIMAVTGQPKPAVVPAALRGWLEKPFTLKELFAGIEAALGRRPPIAAAAPAGTG